MTMIVAEEVTVVAGMAEGGRGRVVIKGGGGEAGGGTIVEVGAEAGAEVGVAGDLVVLLIIT